MMETKYFLYLDESGGFREHNNMLGPSIVGGYLRKNTAARDEWAEQCLQRVHAYTPDYSHVSIKPFHAMEDFRKGVPGVGAFITDLLSFFVGGNTRMVEFINQKNVRIVDETTTYLHVYADGILALIKDLLQESSDRFELQVVVAQRQDDKKRELKKSGIIPQDENISIPYEEYRRRLDERVQILRAKLPTADQRRIRNISISIASATKAKPLMLADAVCFALRGGRNALDESMRNRIRDLPIMRYEVPEKESWEAIKDCFMQGRYADAISLWYSFEDQSLSKHYQEEFVQRILQYFQLSNTKEIEITCAILSKTINQLMNNRAFAEANAFIAKLNENLFPSLEENLPDGKKDLLARLKFDIGFYRLTSATHEGDNEAAEQAIAYCQALLPSLPKTYETIDYYVRYRLRVVEYLKNIYGFTEAKQKLGNLVKSMEELMDVVKLIDGLEEYSRHMTSDTLGRILGSRVQTRLYLALSDISQLAEAARDCDKAEQQFVNLRDKKRIYQYRAEIASMQRNTEQALRWLSMAFADQAVTDGSLCLQAILSSSEKNNQKFGLMHFSNIMAQAMLRGDMTGTNMLQAWGRWRDSIQGVFSSDRYPASIILWRLGTCYALIGEKRAKGYYQRAVAASEMDRNSYTNMAAALTIRMEAAALLKYPKDRDITQLQENYQMFMRQDLPDSLREYLHPWHDAIERLDNNITDTQRNMLLQYVQRMPIL